LKFCIKCDKDKQVGKMLYVLIVVLTLIISILLIGAVLIQPGKGDMISGMSGLSGQFASMIGSRSALSKLSRFTIGSAVALALLALITNKFLIGTEEEILRPATEIAAPSSTTPTTAPQMPMIPETTPENTGDGNQGNQDNGQQEN
jgi:preprotein translocase subunit SecG